MFLVDFFRKKRWSPWLAGALLGLTATGCMAIVGRRLSSSGGFESIVSNIVSALHLSWGQMLYFDYVKPPVLDFQIIQYVGMIFGAFVASYLSRDFKWHVVPDEEWTSKFGPSRVKRWIAVFIGGMCLEFGASVAGGCTSGLGITGMIQLAPAAFVFIIGAFASGIPVTLLFYRRDYR